MLFQFVAFPNKLYRQSYEASNMKGWDLKKWVRASLVSVAWREESFKCPQLGFVSFSSLFFSFFLKFKNKNIVKSEKSQNMGKQH